MYRLGENDWTSIKLPREEGIQQECGELETLDQHWA